MLLALDAGNTNVTVGIFRDGQLMDHRRLRTVREQTSDEWGILLMSLLRYASLDPAQVDGIIVSSVVPPLNSALAEMSQRYFGMEAMFVTAGTDTGLKILYDNPNEVGADRIVNSVAALAKYGGPCVIVDLGTAITFDAISANAEYLGGIIAAGIGISAEALFSRTESRPGAAACLAAARPCRGTRARLRADVRRAADRRHRRSGGDDRVGLALYPARGRESHA